MLIWVRQFGASRGITVNCLSVGSTSSDLQLPADAPISKQFLDLTRADHRFGTPEDIANIALLVASPLAGWLTGQVISASGGITGL